MRRLDTASPDFEAGFERLIADRRADDASVEADVSAILAQVRQEGDAALLALTARFDGADLSSVGLRVEASDIDAAVARVSPERAEALDIAARRIEAFHRAQMPADLSMIDEAGVRLGMRWTALDAVGLYVPGGTASYPSSVLMNAIPAQVAGVGRVAMCVPGARGIAPLVLAAARRAGVSEIWRVGGAQAIAAMAYGTASIRPVDRIVGPGNAWVAEAKRQVFGTVGIDSVAGPSDVTVLGDAGSDPRALAIDLLAQAEHDEAAAATLITDDARLADAVADAVEIELETLARAAIARASWRRHGAIIVARDWDEGCRLVDRLAPEHLQIVTRDPADLFGRIRHAGSVFLGHWTPEAVGDYVGGPNHVLPTGGTARFASGLSVYDFLKRTTWLEADEASLARIGPAAVVLAEAEGLGAHARSVALRLGQTGRA
jgi:histidinol dehydrogenase